MTESGSTLAALIIIMRSQIDALRAMLSVLEGSDDLTDEAREFLALYRADAAKGDPTLTDRATKFLAAPKKRLGAIQSGKY